MNIVKTMAICLSCTIIIELIVAIILKIKDKKDLLYIILVNIITNPLVVSISLYINIKYGLNIRNISMIILEVSAFIIEALIYLKVLKYKRINPFILSLILNGSSYFIGELINRFL